MEPLKVIVSPNPTKNTFRVKCATQSVISSTLLDVFGRELLQKSGVGDIEFDCNSYQSGIYFIRIIVDSKVITRSLIIEK